MPAGEALNTTAAPITVGGHQAYGVFVTPAEPELPQKYGHGNQLQDDAHHWADVAEVDDGVLARGLSATAPEPCAPASCPRAYLPACLTGRC